MYKTLLASLCALCAFFMSTAYADEHTYLVYNVNADTRVVLDPQALCVSTNPDYKWHRAAIQTTSKRVARGCYIQGEGPTKDMYIIVWKKDDRSELPMSWFKEAVGVSEEPKATL